MNLHRFQHLLDGNGADLSRWPGAARRDAERLVADDPAAASALAAARRLDALIGADRNQVRPDAAARILDTLAARALPRQRRGFLSTRWPLELLDVDYGVAWPRIAALAGVGVLGFVIGLADLPINRGTSAADSTILATAEGDLSAIVFEQDPLPEIRP